VRHLKKGVGFIGKEVKGLIVKLSDGEFRKLVDKISDFHKNYI